MHADPNAPAAARVAVLLGLGTNVGDRRANLDSALAALGRIVAIDRRSPVYETAPMYVTDQAPFLNQAITGLTALEPAALLAALKRLEVELGRRPGRRFGPRRIDIDILLYGDRSVHLPELDIPHPRMAERGFVLAPAADIAADWRHPETGETVAAMLAALGPLADVRRVDAP